MTVAEMDRLENAARLSMGGLPELDGVPPATARRAFHVVLGGCCLLAVVMLAAALATS